MTNLPTPRKDESSCDPVPEHEAALVHVKQPLRQGHNKYRLIRQLALAEKTVTALAEEYGVGPSAISMFRKRHEDEIAAVQVNAADEFAGLWIADKKSRLAELQEAATHLAQRSPLSARDAEVLAKLLKDAAEELGELPNRTSINVNQSQVEYKIVGVNLDDLQ